MKTPNFGGVAADIHSHGPSAAPSNRFIPSTPQASASHAPLPDLTGTASQFQVIEGVRYGLTPQVAGKRVRSLIKKLEVTVAEMAVLLAIPNATATRLDKPSIALTGVEIERLLFLEQVVAHGVAVFEDQGKFNRWLRRPLSILNGQSSLQLLDTATGFRVVDQLLGRIEQGVYS